MTQDPLTHKCRKWELSWDGQCSVLDEKWDGSEQDVVCGEMCGD